MTDDPIKLGIPPALQQISISDFAALEPRDLILNPARLISDASSAGRAILYARSGDKNTYDSIGFRTFAASPRVGPSPLQTSEWTALQRNLNDRQKQVTIVDEILNQQSQLRHRPLAFPREDGKYRFQIDSDTIHVYRRITNEAGRETEDRWIFSLTDLPETLLFGAIDRDEPLIAAQRLQVSLQGTHWLRFSTLLEEGRFRRLQEVRDKLVRRTEQGSFYCFLSHRWLDPKHPDPDALQARFTAWQLFAHLAEAVRVADQRGLHQPRRFSSELGKAVGPRGTDIAESLIVNVLRFALDGDTLHKAAAEVLPLEAELEDFGVANATKDVGLKELNRILGDHPILGALTDRIFIWYDYSCLPQPPRDGSDVDLFMKGLEELAAAQIIGRTSIMLDDADDYLSRAWCILEALVADNAGGAMDLVVGSARPSTAKGEVEQFFDMLIQDRPHVMWRAILDTEVFGIQTITQCIARLGLAVTDPNDLPFIYKRLTSLNAPARIHIDDSEIITGVIPLPAFEDGKIAVMSVSSGRALIPDPKPAPTMTLDWSDALSVGKSWDSARDTTAIPPFKKLASNTQGDSTSCHVAIVGACEGEAILLANWVERHKRNLESLLSVSVSSMSWVASDIAPVGHIALGTLEAVPVIADTWIVVTVSTRLHYCQVTNFITEILKWTGITHATIAVDLQENNVEIVQSAEPPSGVEIKDLITAINLSERPPKTHPGGLFEWQVLENLI
jgi:hypothetical protein